MKPDLLHQATPQTLSWRLPDVAPLTRRTHLANALPATNRQWLAKVAAPMTAAIEQVLAAWPSQPDPAQPVAIERAMSQLTRHVIVQSLMDAFGADAVLPIIGAVLHVHEATSRGLVWALRFLTSEPVFYRRVRSEVNAILGWRKPTVADLDALVCTRMLCQEAFRWQASPFILATRLMHDVSHPLPNAKSDRQAMMTAHDVSSFLTQLGGREPALLTCQLILVMILQRYPNLSPLGFSA